MKKESQDAYTAGLSGQRDYGQNGEAGQANRNALTLREQYNGTNLSGQLLANKGQNQQAPSGDGSEIWAVIFFLAALVIWAAAQGFPAAMQLISEYPFQSLAIFTVVCAAIKYIPKFLRWLLLPEGPT